MLILVFSIEEDLNQGGIVVLKDYALLDYC
jgi:hypothetical protein